MKRSIATGGSLALASELRFNRGDCDTLEVMAFNLSATAGVITYSFLDADGAFVQYLVENVAPFTAYARIIGKGTATPLAEALQLKFENVGANNWRYKCQLS